MNRGNGGQTPPGGPVAAALAAVRLLAQDPSRGLLVLAMMLLGELVLNLLIVYHVPCT